MGSDLKAELSHLKAATKANREPTHEEWADATGMVRILFYYCLKCFEIV